ncbi:hypothetical protein Zm00014a_000924 [Zea mays]|uniref:Uncharacterized protein n=1 Tax=Zea mays TaxID=4577 RepID=A0A317YJM2_MAIZE|nr:hypothetical protein Zm00014a_000924 [Zea mays]
MCAHACIYICMRISAGGRIGERAEHVWRSAAGAARLRLIICTGGGCGGGRCSGGNKALAGGTDGERGGGGGGHEKGAELLELAVETPVLLC